MVSEDLNLDKCLGSKYFTQSPIHISLFLMFYLFFSVLPMLPKVDIICVSSNFLTFGFFFLNLLWAGQGVLSKLVRMAIVTRVWTAQRWRKWGPNHLAQRFVGIGSVLSKERLVSSGAGEIKMSANVSITWLCQEASNPWFFLSICTSIWMCDRILFKGLGSWVFIF